MTSPAPHHIQNRLRRRIEELTGILIAENSSRTKLELLLQAITPDSPNLEACAERLATSPASADLIQTLARHLTIGETHFFREPDQLRVLSTTILPELLRRGSEEERGIRIWHPGCASGEEPYTIAMLLDDLLSPPLHRRPHILATDINPDFLGKADRAIYREWSFRRDFPPAARRYFQTTPSGEHQLAPSIREMVHFGYLNLAEADYPATINGTAALDLICCRNVLMYFSRQQAQRVLNRFHDCLNENGYLLLSPCELPLAQDTPFTLAEINGLICLSKGGGRKGQELRLPALLAADGPLANETLPRWRRLARKHPPPSPTRRHGAGPPAASSRGPAPATEPAAPPSAYQAALEAYTQGKYREAAALLLPLLTTDAKRETSDQEGAVAMLLTRIYANQGQLAEALQWSERMLAVNRVNPAAYLLAGIVHQENNDPEQAARLFSQALYLDQDFVLAHYLLSSQLILLGRKSAADKHLATAASLLEQLPAEGILPESEGITAGQLKAAIAPRLPGRPTRQQGGAP